MNATPGVTFVIPVHNGEPWLERTLSAVLAQRDGRAFEVIAIDDNSSDGSRQVLEAFASRREILLVTGEGRGAAAAINLGIRQASHPIVCQIDQDVILEPGWMVRLIGALSDPTIAAAQGYYTVPKDAGVWARVMGLDLEYRYSRLAQREPNHVCTGNTAYRAEALRRIGLFDERLGYGYDNDVSYRLTQAGFRVVLCSEARSVHAWRDGLAGYVRQQYGFGYGRLDLVARHPRRIAGDDVSPLGMMLHAPIMTAAGAGLLAAGVRAALGWSWIFPAAISAGLIGLLAVERGVAGVAAALRFRDPAGLWFIPAHIVRDIAWATALCVWSVRRLKGRKGEPSHSMRPRRLTKTT